MPRACPTSGHVSVPALCRECRAIERHSGAAAAVRGRRARSASARASTPPPSRTAPGLRRRERGVGQVAPKLGDPRDRIAGVETVAHQPAADDRSRATAGRPSSGRTPPRPAAIAASTSSRIRVMCGTVVVPMSTIGCGSAPRAGDEPALVRLERVGGVRQVDEAASRRAARTRAGGANASAGSSRARIRAGKEPVGDAIAVPGGEEHAPPTISAGGAGRSATRSRTGASVSRHVPCPRGRRPGRAPRARVPPREAADDARPVSALAERAPARLQPDDEPRPDRHLRRA